MASPNVIELTADNFDEHVKSGTLVVADFWALRVIILSE